MADLTRDLLADPFCIARASRYSAPEAGGDALPIIYGDLTVPARATAGVYRLPEIDTAGAGTYCVAGHEIKGSVSLFDAAGLIAVGDYTLNLANDYQGVGVIATAAFSVAPAGSVTGVCQGKKDTSGALIENPFDIVEDLMLNFWGFTEQDLNRQALNRAIEGAGNLSYKAAGLIAENLSPMQALTDLLGDFLGWFETDADKRLRVGILGQEAGTVFPAAALPSLEAAEVTSRRSRDSIVNQTPVLYAKNYTDGRHIKHEDGETTKDAASQVVYGARLPARGHYVMDWVREDATAKAVQARIVERNKDPQRVISIRGLNWRALGIEVHDYVIFSVSWLRTAELQQLTNQIGEVLSLPLDMRAQTMEVRLRDTGYFLTTARIADGSSIADGSYLAGGARDLSLAA